MAISSSKPFQSWQALLLPQPQPPEPPAPVEPPAPPPIAADDPRLLQAREQAREAGYAQGYAAGLEQGLAEGRQRAAAQLAADAARLTALLDSLAAPLAELEQELGEGLLQLACALARQVVRHELSAVPQHIGELVREAVAALPAAARQIRVYLNPQDLELVRAVAPSGAEQTPWELLPDPQLERGGCRISSESSQLDLSLEARLAAAFARLREAEAP